jgi:hypothetical protein
MHKAEYPNISLSKYLIIDFLFVFCKKECGRLFDFGFVVSDFGNTPTSDVRHPKYTEGVIVDLGQR